MVWTEERVAIASKRWLEGISATQIAKELGSGLTRNAVIGKIHRLGLAGRATPSRPAKRPVRVARPRVIQPSTPRLRSIPAPVERVVIEVVPARREDGRLETVQSIEANQCRYPIGHPDEKDFGFCGHKCEGAYCLGHRAIVYQPERKEKRARTMETVQINGTRVLVALKAAA